MKITVAVYEDIRDGSISIFSYSPQDETESVAEVIASAENCHVEEVNILEVTTREDRVILNIDQLLAEM